MKESSGCLNILWNIQPWPHHASQTIFVEKADTACDGAEAWPGKNKALCLSAGSIVQQERSFSGLIIAATFKHHLHNHEQFHIQIRTKMAS